jgi:hypothetical protein
MIMKYRNLAKHGPMARSGHGLPKVLFRPSMPYPSTLCGQATPEMWPAHRAGGMRLSSTSLDTPRCTPMNPAKTISLFLGI